MGFNGIAGAVNVPGEIPWQIITLYFAVALAVAFIVGKRTGGLRAFTTIDLIYIGIGGAFAVVWDFYIADFIGRFIPSNPFISIGFWGRLITVFIVAALVRKVGVGMLTMFVFNLLADIFHYGFGGEPLWFVYESLTYGLFLDLMIAATGGRLFGLPNLSSLSASRPLKPSSVNPNPPTQIVEGTTAQLEEEEAEKPRGSASITKTTFLVGAIEGAIVGALWAFPYAVFYLGFFRPFIFGKIVNWGYIYFYLATHIPIDAIVGAIAAILAIIVVRAVGS